MSTPSTLPSTESELNECEVSLVRAGWTEMHHHPTQQNRRRANLQLEREAEKGHVC